MMNVPVTYTIVMKSKRYTSGWEEVFGHCCGTKEEMEDYCDTLGGSLRVVPAPYNPGEVVKEVIAP